MVAKPTLETSELIDPDLIGRPFKRVMQPCCSVNVALFYLLQYNLKLWFSRLLFTDVALNITKAVIIVIMPLSQISCIVRLPEIIKSVDARDVEVMSEVAV